MFRCDSDIVNRALAWCFTYDIGVNLSDFSEDASSNFLRTECCGLRINRTYSSVQSCWIRSLISVTLVMTSTASAEACILAPSIDLRHQLCTYSNRHMILSVVQAHAGIVISRCGRTSHLCSVVPVAGISHFLPPINLLILEKALVALLAAYSACA